MELEKQRFRSEYLLESAHKTLQAGTVTAWLSLPVIAGLMLQDHYLLGLDNIWPWRLLGGFPFWIFLGYRYFFASRLPKLAIPLNIVNMIGILLMMAGIAITVLIDPAASLLNQYGVSVGLLTALFICLIIAVGARKGLVYLIPSVLILASLALFIWGGEIGAERFGFLSNSYIIGILVIIFAIVQDRRQLNDFFLRKKIELRESQLSQKTSELEILNQSLESFSYTVSHDLRGPLRNMIGLSTILQRKTKGETEFAEITDTIISNAYKMNKLVDDILSFSKATNQPLKPQNLDMHCLFGEVFQELRPNENGRDIEFILEPLEAASGDPAMIRQVVINLLSNALKYTRNKNHTLISVSGKLDPQGAYYYQIRDNGVGFNPEQKTRLFMPFSRLHEGGEFEGNGVGLAFIQKILERHHGAIWAEGQENVGATFSFTLPMQTLGN
ncbi:MAG: ATP-binding protein [Bacteroidia bacterium]